MISLKNKKGSHITDAKLPAGWFIFHESSKQKTFLFRPGGRKCVFIFTDMDIKLENGAMRNIPPECGSDTSLTLTFLFHGFTDCYD